MAEKFEAIKPSHKKFNMMAILMDKYGERLSGLLLASLITLLLAAMVGHAAATKQIQYYVLTDRPSYVLLRSYNDEMIFSQYDSTTKSIGATITIIKMSSNTEISLTEKEIGPLFKTDTFIVNQYRHTQSAQDTLREGQVITKKSNSQ